MLLGELFWMMDKMKFYDGWNIYSLVIVWDLDYDGVGEIVIVYGGDLVIFVEVWICIIVL